MATIKEISEKFDIKPISSFQFVQRTIAGGYASDLLSCVLRNAKRDDIWVTLQCHENVVAVASMAGLAGIIITEGNTPDQEMLARADKEGVVLMVTPKTTFTVVSELASLGIRGEKG